MKIKIALATIAAAIMLAGAPAASAAPPSAGLNLPVTLTSASGAVTNAAFHLSSFANQNGQLVALGTITQVVNGVVQITQVSVPVSAAGSTCEILNLDIKPISLNLLGLQVTTSEIVVNIAAQPGPGNLLGNLLCDVSHLLDTNGLGGLVAQLNNILSQL